MNVHLRVTVDGRYFSVGAGIEVPELYRECFEPTRSGDEPLVMMAAGECTQETARTVMKTREDAADILAKELAAMIVLEMKKNDTFNGYKD